ncbi:MAG: glycosyltransferase family 1 protein [Acidobacteria bacterium]|nr:MAG: glycosyltransferase family 1 protein [Acidobacteriota bacterium]
MRIAFDARPLIGARTGVGVWLDGLLRGLAAATGWSFVLCLPRRVDDLGVGDLGGRLTVLAPPVPLPGTLWLQTVAGPSVAGRADVFVGSLGVRPRRLSVPDVLMVHDLTPRTRPRAHTLANRMCFNAYIEESLASTQTLVCLSEATREAVSRIQPGAARRARVIGAGVDPFFSPAGDGEDGGETRRRFTGGRPFIVQLGTLEPRKGIATLLAAHALLLARRPDAPDLVLAGGRGWGRGWLAAALERHPDPSRIHRPGYVNRDDARALLRHADLVTLVSEEEGFGLPLAEALACGAACIASDAPALVEVAAGAARHVARGDAAALAAAAAAALDPEAQRALRAAARRRGAELTWEGPLAAWRDLLEGIGRGQSTAGQLRMPGDAPARH